MDINVEHFRKILRDKERDLQFEISQLKSDEERPEGPEVGDPADQASLETQTNVAVEEAGVLTRTLAEVRAALGRIEDGTYGKCSHCGRQIQLPRLEAIPWTQYCLEHQPDQAVGRLA